MSPIAQTEWVPERLGRYDVIGELATGGMAQILLAKPSEPGGFKRLVVLKRILPHLSDDKAFIQMFHDEARIVGGLDHPNVVQVHELEEGSDGMFMVMEFLDGESMFGLMRRLTRLKRKLSHDLAIHLVAEACSGLHAAHELRDDQDRPLDLVHRDISPHNLFITYSGKLKVIDFGIAKTENRITRTETGQLKGKFEYMSPEQCAAQPVDRRADVYALGIVLYELVTGRRLFKRANELLTIRAVTEQPIIPPSELNPECSPDLEAVTMRALAREPADRFESCAKLRRALLRVLREEHRSPKLPDDQLFELMQALFPDRIEEKKVILAAIQDGNAPAKLPRPEVDLQYAVPEISDEELRAHTHTRNVEATVSKRLPRAEGSAEGTDGGGTGSGAGRPRSSSSSQNMRAVTPSSTSSPGMAAVTPGAGSASAISSPGMPAVTERSSPGMPAPVIPGSPAPLAERPQPRPVPKASSRSHIASGIGVFCAVIAIGIVVLMMFDDGKQDIVRVDSAPPPVRPPAVATSSVSEAEATHVQVHLESDPPGAVLTLGGQVLGRAPLDVAVERSGEQTQYTMALPGYQLLKGTLVPIGDIIVKQTLVKQLAVAPSAPLSEAEEARRAKRRERREQRRLEGSAQPDEPVAPPAPRTVPKPKKDDPFTRFD